MARARPAVFLDRDGVLNAATVVGGVPRPPVDPSEVVLLDGVVGACAALRRAGLELVVVTNQPDIARGSTDARTVAAINERLATLLPLELFYVCPHDDDDRCRCRKPAPGMLVSAARDHGLHLGRSVMVGDRWRDVEAGRRAGCRTVHVDHGYDEPTPLHSDLSTGSLAGAVGWIVHRLREADVA